MGKTQLIMGSIVYEEEEQQQQLMPGCQTAFSKGMGTGSRKMARMAILKIQYLTDCLSPKSQNLAV